MYLAELHGKLSPKLERMEDVLTSNVFSFFKYSAREVFLKGYLEMLGFGVSEQEAGAAEFLFWHRFEDNTEPDLIIRLGIITYFLKLSTSQDSTKELESPTLNYSAKSEEDNRRRTTPAANSI